MAIELSGNNDLRNEETWSINPWENLKLKMVNKKLE